MLGELIQAAKARAQPDELVISSEDVSMVSPRDQYGSPDYWEARYQVDGAEGQVFEWLSDWAYLAPSLAPVLTSVGAHDDLSRVLHVGAGNSTLGIDLWKAGFGRGGVVNTDISETVCSQMGQRFRDAIFVRDDALDMQLARSLTALPPTTTLTPALVAALTLDADPVNQLAFGFDAIVDKGTLDAFACTVGSGEDKAKQVLRYLEECRAVLKPTGKLVIISFGQPETRLKFFESEHWTCEWSSLHEQSATPLEASSATASQGLSKPRTKTQNYMYILTRTA